MKTEFSLRLFPMRNHLENKASITMYGLYRCRNKFPIYIGEITVANWNSSGIAYFTGQGVLGFCKWSGGNSSWWKIYSYPFCIWKQWDAYCMECVDSWWNAIDLLWSKIGLKERCPVLVQISERHLVRDMGLPFTGWRRKLAMATCKKQRR